jgi:hypothetical protein
LDGPTQLLAHGLDSTPVARRRQRRDDDAWQLSIDIDLELARNSEVNVLIVGPEPGAEELVRRLLPQTAGQVADNRITVRCHDGLMPLPSPPGGEATLVIRDVDALSSGEQYRLLQWLDAASDHGPIVSTAAAPLLPLVEAGMFSEALFYRLNTIYIDLFE